MEPEIVGVSPLAKSAEWLEVAKNIDQSRWKQFYNASAPTEEERLQELTQLLSIPKLAVEDTDSNYSSVKASLQQFAKTIGTVR